MFLLPELGAGVARTAWGSSPVRGWGSRPPGCSPDAAPGPRTARRTGRHRTTHPR